MSMRSPAVLDDMLEKRFDRLVLVAGVLVSGLASVLLGQDSNWDLRNYHFYNGYSFLNGRLGFDIAPAQIQTYYNPVLDVPVYWLMTHLPPVVYGFLLGALHGVNIYLIYRIAHSLLAGLPTQWRRGLGIACAVTGYYGAVNLMEIGASFHDNVTSLFVLGAVLLVISKSGFESGSRVAAAGFLVGFGTGLKLVIGVYAGAFGLCLLLVGPSFSRRLKNMLVAAAAGAVGAAITMGYWMVTLTRRFESPLFPYFNKIFRSPYYELNTNYTDATFAPHGTYKTLFYPFYFLAQAPPVSETQFEDVRFPVCYLALGLLLFMAYYMRATRSANGATAGFPAPSRLDSGERFLLAWFVLSYILWQVMFAIYRYLLPLEMLAPVFLLVIARYIFPARQALVRAALAVFALIVLAVRPMGGWRMRKPWSSAFFDVRVPAVAGLDRSIVILADNAPLSYIIPSFPSGTRFVSVRNNFMFPSATTKLEDVVRKTLRRCGGDMYLLYRGASKEPYGSFLESYQLSFRPTPAAKIATKFDDDLYLMPVSRTGPCVAEETDGPAR